jgi:hypothetical protein
MTAPAAPAVLRDAMLDRLAEQAEGRPVYLAVARAVSSRFADEIAALLRRKCPQLNLVTSRGRYGSRDAWRARWPQEQGRYSGGILLTAAEPLAGDAEPSGVPGLHIVDGAGAFEVGTLAGTDRPVAWLPAFGGTFRVISRFALEATCFPTDGRFARCFTAGDADQLVPAIGELPFARWLTLVR